MNKKMQELEKKTPADLKKVLSEKQDALREFRFSMTGSRTRDTKLGARLRKDVARIRTLLARTDTETAQQ